MESCRLGTGCWTCADCRERFVEDKVDDESVPLALVSEDRKVEPVEVSVEASIRTR